MTPNKMASQIPSQVVTGGHLPSQLANQHQNFMHTDNRQPEQQQPVSSEPQTAASSKGCCCYLNCGDTFRILLKIARVIIFISCIVLTVVSIITAGFVASKSPRSVYSILECAYLLVIVTIGFYATLYHSKQAFILFSVACAINSVLLIVSLLVKAEKSLYGYGAAYRSVQYLQKCIDPSLCSQPESCCQPENGSAIRKGPNYSNVIIGDDPTLYALLWCLAIYHIMLTILSGLIATCAKSNPSPVQGQTRQQQQHRLGSHKSPGNKPISSQMELRLDSDVSTMKQMPTTKPAHKESTNSPEITTRSAYKAQPVILISQPGRQIASLLASGVGGGGTRVSPPKSPMPESSIDQIKNATTRVE